MKQAITFTVSSAFRETILIDDEEPKDLAYLWRRMCDLATKFNVPMNGRIEIYSIMTEKEHYGF